MTKIKFALVLIEKLDPINANQKLDPKRSCTVQFSSVQFSFISAPPHEQNNKMLKSLCVVKDGVRKRKKQQNELTLCLAN